MPNDPVLPTSLAEMDHLKLKLAHEKKARLQAENVNLQIAQRHLKAEIAAFETENTAFFEKLRVTYGLNTADEIGEDGVIKRAPQAEPEKTEP